MNIIREYFSELYSLSAEMAPYLMLGFLFAGILHVYIRKESIVRYLGGKGLKSVFYAALLGIPLPLCSCGVIPTGIAFHKEGASKAAAISFLISTPQTGVDSILVTWSLLGWPMAIIRPVAALITGLIGGGLSLASEPQPVDASVASPAAKAQTDHPRWVAMLRYAFVDFMEDIAKWLLIGLLLAALMAVAIPDGFFTQHLDNPFLGMLMVLVASIPLYVCATGSVPIAAVLLMKGLSPGAALVFLMAGPATNIATMTVIGKALGKRALVAYLGSIIGGALLFGFLTDQFISADYLLQMMNHNHDGHAHHLIPEWINIVSLIFLTFFIGYALLRKAGLMNSGRKSTKTLDMASDIHIISVTGMTCNHCRDSVEKTIGGQQGVTNVQADIHRGIVSFEAEAPDLEQIRVSLESLGYGYQGEIESEREV
jgi:uncharacterized protein